LGAWPLIIWEGVPFLLGNGSGDPLQKNIDVGYQIGARLVVHSWRQGLFEEKNLGGAGRDFFSFGGDPWPQCRTAADATL